MSAKGKLFLSGNGVTDLNASKKVFNGNTESTDQNKSLILAFCSSSVLQTVMWYCAPTRCAENTVKLHVFSLFCVTVRCIL